MAQVNSPALTEEEQVLVKVDRESAYRRLTGKWAMAVAFLGISLSAFQLYTAVFGVLPPTLQRAPHLSVAVGMIYLLYPARRGDIKDHVPWYDVILALAGLGAGFYHVIFYQPLLERAGTYTPMDLVVAAVAVVLVLEATRRVAGWPMIIVAITFLIYAYLGPYMPGFLRHRGYSLERILAHTYLATEGMLGIPIAVSSTLIYIYLLFATFLGRTGIRQFFIDIAMALTGFSAGGPAKAAVVSSALEGTISGSSIANTAGSGSFTIPMMKSLGYRPEFAAAVEASASTGGQIMPPIMGAAAFVMVEFIDKPYIEIAKAAAIPAILYFLGVFIMVHFEAKRVGLTPVDPATIPSFKKLMLQRGYLLIPLLGIIYLLEEGATPMKAAFYGIVLAVLAGLVRKETRLGIRDIIATMEETARGALSVIVACATAGIIVGIVTLTGLGLKISNNVIDLAGGNLLLTLGFTMIASLILGMGIPTTATYIVLATMAAPALVNLGVPVIAAHLFVFYFGIVADITPPVALAVYAGAAIAKSNPWKTGIEAVKLALAGFIIPYVFAMSPSIVLVNVTTFEVIRVLIGATLGMVGVGAGVIGYFSTSLNAVERLAFFIGGLLLIDPGVVTDVMGIVLVGGAYLVQRRRVGRGARAPIQA